MRYKVVGQIEFDDGSKYDVNEIILASDEYIAESRALTMVLRITHKTQGHWVKLPKVGKYEPQQ